MLRLGKERDQINVVFDQIGSPTYAADLAAAIMQIIDKIEAGMMSWEEASGVYNYSNEGVVSWYDFANAIFDIRATSCKVIPVRSEQFQTEAERPSFSLMDKTLVKETFGLEIPYWRDSLKHMLRLLP
jgi:dTDP-4-dehydrorhamnose reductase